MVGSNQSYTKAVQPVPLQSTLLQYMKTLRPINRKKGRQLTQTTLFSLKRKKSCSGGIRTHDTLLARQML